MNLEDNDPVELEGW